MASNMCGEHERRAHTVGRRGWAWPAFDGLSRASRMRTVRRLIIACARVVAASQASTHATKATKARLKTFCLAVIWTLFWMEAFWTLFWMRLDWISARCTWTCEDQWGVPAGRSESRASLPVSLFEFFFSRWCSLCLSGHATSLQRDAIREVVPVRFLLGDPLRPLWLCLSLLRVFKIKYPDGGASLSQSFCVV